MGTRPKQRHRPKGKVDYKEWQRFRTLTEEARTENSWRELALKLGRNEGWAEAAYQHRGLVDDTAIRDMERLVMKQRAERDGIQSVAHDRSTGNIIGAHALVPVLNEKADREEDDRLADPNVREYVDTVSELRATPYRLYWDQIGRIFGYPSGGGAKMAFSHGRSMQSWRLERARPIVAMIRGGQLAEAVRLADRTPLPKDGKREATITDQAIADLQVGPGLAVTEPPAPAPPPAPATARAALAAPAPIPPAPPPAPDAFAWLDDVQVGLMELAERVQAEMEKAPKMMHDPYRSAIEKLSALAAEFDR